MKKWKIILTLLGITIFAFLLRFSPLFYHDFYFLVDQARDLLLVKGMVVDHKLTLIGARTGLGGLFHGPLWLYMIVPFFYVFKGNPYLTLVPLFALVNLAIIVLAYLVGYKLYGYKFGFLLAFILSLSSGLISAVPSTSNSQVLPNIILLYLYSVIMYLRGSRKFLILSMFLVGIGFQFESAFAFLMIFLTIFAMLLKKTMPSVKQLFSGIVLFLLPLSTFLIFDVRHQFLMTNSFMRLITSPVKPLPGYEKYSSIAYRIVDRIFSYLSSFSALLFKENLLTLILLLAIIALALAVYIYKKFKFKKFETDKEYLFLFFSPLIIFAIYVFYPLPLWPHYLLPVLVFAAMLLSYSIKQLWRYNYARYLITLFLLLLFYPTLIWIKDIYVLKPAIDTKSDGLYSNQLNVAKWIFKDAGNSQYGYFVYSSGALTYNMDYLMWWVNYTNHHQQPENKKLSPTYLIFYPHKANDNNAYTFWEKNVIRTSGKLLLKQEFKGGIIVEKLSIDTKEPDVDPNYYQNLIFR